MKAEPLYNAVTVLSVEEMSDGVEAVLVDVADYDAYLALPRAIKFEGKIYGRTGWNSDLRVAYFRSDAAIAFPA